MSQWLPVVILGLLLAVVIGGIAHWASPERHERARTVSSFSASSSATVVPTVTPVPTWTPTSTPTATSSATPTRTVLPSPTASLSAPAVGAVEEDASAVAGVEALDSEKSELPFVEDEWEQGLGGPLWMQDPSTWVTPLPAPTPTPLMHVVAAGENLSLIAAQYGRTVEALAAANDIEVDSILQIDQELIIPPSQQGGKQDDAEASDALTLEAMGKATATPTETPNLLIHTVQRGDTLSAIAVLYDVDMEVIAEANDWKVDDFLQLGQELVIPGLTPTPVPSPTATPSPTPKATNTPSLTPTLADTPTPTLPYRQPQLLAPPDGSMVEGQDEGVVLNWTSVGVLAEDEWYMLCLWPPEEEEPLVVWTKTTSWRVPTEMYPGEGVLDAIDWQVTIAVRQDEEANGVPISLPSEQYTFLWR
ncbi:MAG: LysM peptidoglycan-binding domain-containing protein [Chloroflexota bacterium]|nr:LysM peptidoglycan-binding domain-containing protein [Chloroflexota bacterium]